jgi:hypothetical protein
MHRLDIAQVSDPGLVLGVFSNHPGDYGKVCTMPICEDSHSHISVELSQSMTWQRPLTGDSPASPPSRPAAPKRQVPPLTVLTIPTPARSAALQRRCGQIDADSGRCALTPFPAASFSSDLRAKRKCGGCQSAKISSKNDCISAQERLSAITSWATPCKPYFSASGLVKPCRAPP